MRCHFAKSPEGFFIFTLEMDYNKVPPEGILKEVRRHLAPTGKFAPSYV
jgi:hypothetical protein